MNARTKKQAVKKKQSVVSKYAIYLVLILLIAILAIVAKGFIAPVNLFNIMRQVSLFGIAAVGMTMVILTGGIDLSVGSLMASSTVLGALLMNAGVSQILTVLLVLVYGLIVGLFDGFFICQIKISPLITTLATMGILRGLGYILSGGMPIYNIPPEIKVIGQGYVGPIPIPVIIMFVIFAIGYVILTKTAFGRYIYGIGSNKEASVLSGINVNRVMYKVYALSGVFSAVAGVVLLARINSGNASVADGYEMDVITACVLGGVSITGGEGNIIRVIIGLLIIGVLANGMIMLNIPDYYQRVVKGAVLLAAISYDMLSKEASKKV